MIKSINITKILICLFVSSFSLLLSQSLKEIGNAKAEYEKLLKEDLNKPQEFNLDGQNPLSNIPRRPRL